MSLTTFREIEIAKGIAPRKTQEESALSDWYARMRDIPLSEFGVADLSRSVRQELYPEYVVPVALETLEREPLAGDLYDGESALSFRWVSKAFWREHPGSAGRLLCVLKDALPRLDDDFKPDAMAAIARIEGLGQSAGKPRRS